MRGDAPVALSLVVDWHVHWASCRVEGEKRTDWSRVWRDLDRAGAWSVHRRMDPRGAVSTDHALSFRWKEGMEFWAITHLGGVFQPDGYSLRRKRGSGASAMGIEAVREVFPFAPR